MKNKHTKNQKGFTASKIVVVVALLIIVIGVYMYVAKTSSANSFSVSGYVVYESPTGNPGYDFLIVSASSTPVIGTLPTMEGFPSLSDPSYSYIGYAGYGGTLPNIGDKVTVNGRLNPSIETNPPYAFAAKATGINVLVDAQFNATITGLMQTIQ